LYSHMLMSFVLFDMELFNLMIVTINIVFVGRFPPLLRVPYARLHHLTY